MEEIGDEVIKEIIEIENPNNDNGLSCIKKNKFKFIISIILYFKMLYK